MANRMPVATCAPIIRPSREPMFQAVERFGGVGSWRSMLTCMGARDKYINGRPCGSFAHIELIGGWFLEPMVGLKARCCSIAYPPTV